MESVSGKVLHGNARLNENGRVVIPVEMRKLMELNAGDTLFLSVEDGVLRMESQKMRIRRVQQSLSQLIPPARCLSDELIAERREEARREMEQPLG